jgi:N-acetylmuramoyl-L-alanine amidase
MRWISYAALLCVLTAGWVSAQTSPTFNREMVVIDPAHGGTDGGARINDHLEEKEVTLALAARLRYLLSARGFTVVSTRQDDLGSRPVALLTNDQRAEAANKARAVACLVIHASASGNGISIGTSALGSSIAAVPQNVPVTHAMSGAVPWDQAQEAYVAQSLGLASQVGAALIRAKVPVMTGRIAMRPLDNMTCPAIAIEVSELHSGSNGTQVSDEQYQQRVAEAIAGALVLWKNQAQQPEYVPVPVAAPRPGGGA